MNLLIQPNFCEMIKIGEVDMMLENANDKRTK